MKNFLGYGETMPKPIIYTRTTCGPCRTVKYWMKSKNIAFEEKNIDDNPKLLDDIIKLSGLMVVPVVVIGENIVTGANIPQLSKLLS